MKKNNEMESQDLRVDNDIQVSEDGHSIIARLDEIILEYAQRKDNRETKDCAIMARGRIIPLYSTRK